MTNIIFLDLDGPAFPDAVIQYHPNQRKPYPGDFEMGESLSYWHMCERFKHLWILLHETRDFEVVISSSWRKYYSKESCFYDLFEQNGLPLTLHKDWKTIVMSGNTYGCYSSGYTPFCARASEIHEWIMRHPEIKRFMILDDPDSGISLDHTSKFWNQDHGYMEDNIVLVDPDTGFGSIEMLRALRITQKWLK